MSAGTLVLVVLVLVVLALVADGGRAPTARAAAAKCPNLTVTRPGVSPQGVPGTYAIVLRFVLQGAGCRESRQAISVYFSDVAKGKCANHGTACLLRIPGWNCGLGFKGLGPALAGCSRIGQPSHAFAVVQVGPSKLVKAPKPPATYFM